jgi:hypothetical protein
MSRDGRWPSLFVFMVYWMHPCILFRWVRKSFSLLGPCGHMTIHRVLNGQLNISQAKNNPDTVRTIFNRISRMLSQHMKSMGLPPKKVSSFLRLVKANLGLRTQGVYRIPCECGKVYIGQTGCSDEGASAAHNNLNIQKGQPWLNTPSAWDTTFSFTNHHPCH